MEIFTRYCIYFKILFQSLLSTIWATLDSLNFHINSIRQNRCVQRFERNLRRFFFWKAINRRLRCYQILFYWISVAEYWDIKDEDNGLIVCFWQRYTNEKCMLRSRSIKCVSKLALKSLKPIINRSCYKLVFSCFIQIGYIKPLFAFLARFLRNSQNIASKGLLNWALSFDVGLFMAETFNKQNVSVVMQINSFSNKTKQRLQSLRNFAPRCRRSMAINRFLSLFLWAFRNNWQWNCWMRKEET